MATVGMREVRDMQNPDKPAAALGLLIATLLISPAIPVSAAPHTTASVRHCLPVEEPASDELRKLEAAAKLVGQSDYFNDLMRRSGVEICVEPLMTLFRGFYEPDEHVIVIAALASPEKKALILAHELRHVDQAARGFAPSIDYDMQENIRQIYALEADAEAIAVLFAWSMRSAGNPSVWHALESMEHVDDIAALFERAMLSGKGETAATRIAFAAWSRSEWRVNRYFKAVAGAYLDQLEATRSLQSYRELPRDHFERLCLMPNGESYACRPPKVIP
jgi:hypothetical protein